MRAQDVEWIAVEDDSAPARVRLAATRLAQSLGFGEHRAGQVAIAATELATNLYRHAEHGAVLLRVCRDEEVAGVELVALDKGPGMENVAAACEDGRSTGGTLGIGLGSVVRAATWFRVHSVPGRGTVIAATFFPQKASALPPTAAGLTRPMSQETICGDAWAQRHWDCGTSLVLADGLGHGELAAVAARKAINAFQDAPSVEHPAATIEAINVALRGTRGAAVSALSIDRSTSRVRFAGIGNVSVWIDDGERRQAFAPTPGILGAFSKRVREIECPISPNGVVVLHSDGLTSKWSLSHYPGLRTSDPLVIAATLLRDAGIRHDDACILVSKAA